MTTRRRFLGTLATVAGAGVVAPATLAGCADDDADAGDEGAARGGRAVVVGAGLAGLVAARALAADGWDVTVLEARDRVGGRVRTVREPFVAGQHAEAGGELIDGAHTRLLALVDELGLELEDVGADAGDRAERVVLDGEVWDLDELVEEDDGAVGADLERFEAICEELAADVDPEDPTSAPDAADLDARSVGDLLDELDLDPRARTYVERRIVSEYGVAADRLSLLFHLALTARSADQDDDDVEAFRVAGGNDQVAEALADDLVDLRLGTPVAGVAQDDGGVVVTTADGDALPADHVVLAVPLPALAAVAVEPPLPDGLRAAVTELAYGQVAKVLVQHRRRSWRDDGATGDVVADVGVAEAWEATDAQADGDDDEPGILNHLVPRSGTELDEALALDALALDAPADDVVATHVAAWYAEPASGGTYEAYAPGQVTRFWAVLRRPVGRIHLAGEHTDSWATYMEGAVRSGERAAAEIARQGR